jgi:hypothetical protein
MTSPPLGFGSAAILGFFAADFFALGGIGISKKKGRDE